jgi:hypothetical protein
MLHAVAPENEGKDGDGKCHERRGARTLGAPRNSRVTIAVTPRPIACVDACHAWAKSRSFAAAGIFSRRDVENGGIAARI